MRRVLWMAAVVALWACGPGGGGSLPESPPVTNGNIDAGPGDPTVEPPDTEKPPEANTALWPLTTGTRWKYRITDPFRGVFEKQVEVIGETEIPGTTAKGILVKSTQPHLEEYSYQVIKDGVVFRVREEDRKGGQPVRVMTWTPSVIKALSDAPEAGWTNTATVIEKEEDLVMAIVDEKEKIFTWSVDAVGQTLTVAGKTYEDVIKLRRVRDDKDDWERVYWLAPGVGKIYEEGERTEELIEVDVK